MRFSSDVSEEDSFPGVFRSVLWVAWGTIQISLIIMIDRNSDERDPIRDVILSTPHLPDSTRLLKW